MKMEAINFNVKKIFSLMGHYSIKIFKNVVCASPHHIHENDNNKHVVRPDSENNLIST